MIKNVPALAGYFAASAALLASAGPALAETQSANLSVSATVTKNCTISTTPIAFGNVNVISGQAVDASGTVVVTCTNGTSYSAAIDPGVSPTGSDASSRKMLSGSKELTYNLYTDSARTTAWNAGIAGTGSGVAQNLPIYGRVPANQTAATAGAYTDTVFVALTY